MEDSKIVRDLMDFIGRSPTAYHAADAVRRELDEAGFTALWEKELWHVQPGGRYYCMRNDSAILAFALPERKPDSFHIAASHSDSPSFKIKPGHALTGEDQTVRLNVEKYGGGILETWFDRPLTIAGRVILDEGDSLVSRLVYFDQDLLMIPSLAIHLSRDEKEKKKLSIQTDMLPILGGGKEESLLEDMLTKQLDCGRERILGADLYLVNRQKPTLWGAEKEFLAAPRLDDLEGCYLSLQGFLEAARDAEDVSHAMVYCLFDNEEIGSRTRQGADSGFLRDVLERVCEGLGLVREEFHAAVAGSFLVSADNAHAMHPNYAGKYDPVNRPRLNEGIVLKHQAEQRYATDGLTAAVIRRICRREKIPFQEYTNHSDIAGGSTLGNLSITQLSVPTADIGLPQWAMHSACESAGTADAAAMRDFCRVFYEEALPMI